MLRAAVSSAHACLPRRPPGPRSASPSASESALLRPSESALASECAWAQARARPVSLAAVLVPE